MGIDRKFVVEETHLAIMTHAQVMTKVIVYPGHVVFPEGHLRIDQKHYTIQPHSSPTEILTTAECDFITHNYVAMEH